MLIGLAELEKGEVKSPAQLQLAVSQTERSAASRSQRLAVLSSPSPAPTPPLSSLLANILTKKENLSFISFTLTHTNRAPLHQCPFLIGENTDSAGNSQIPQVTVNAPAALERKPWLPPCDKGEMDASKANKPGPMFVSAGPGDVASSRQGVKAIRKCALKGELRAGLLGAPRDSL